MTKEPQMSSTDEPGSGMADSDINSTDPAGTSNQAGSGAAQASGEDADRGNLDGSAPVAEPRGRSLDEAGKADEAGGNGSFEDASQQTGDSSTSDAGESGQDNGLIE
jgi:hypothetical protein